MSISLELVQLQIRARDLGEKEIFESILKKGFPQVEVSNRAGSGVVELKFSSASEKIRFIKKMPEYLPHIRCERLVLRHGSDRTEWSTSDMAEILQSANRFKKH